MSVDGRTLFMVGLFYITFLLSVVFAKISVQFMYPSTELSLRAQYRAPRRIELILS
jgi:hypothetical protein